jgi:hypothetical protein
MVKMFILVSICNREPAIDACMGAITVRRLGINKDMKKRQMRN